MQKNEIVKRGVYSVCSCLITRISIFKDFYKYYLYGKV